MKYADCPTVEVETRIAVRPDQVWPWVADITTPCRFSSELKGAEWVDTSVAPEVGSRFVGFNWHRAMGDWETTSVVVEYEESKVFAWAVGDVENPSASWRFELVPDGDGTLLRQWARMGPAPSGLTFAIQARPDKEERIVARRLNEFEANMRTTVEGIKALAEGLPD
ncbi:SRPBCC family protein [Amycolatopsis nigrescens]|uniref:SRPBCC family protein n=1 Tax=Amycolatopsis nigrescens TaxID=381445 RepID=UPI000371CF01|nr:SRPBCC family protein [Amycolatopsis nigrescens]